MRKYFTVFAIDWQNQFIYRLNFVLWRFRNVLRLLMAFFLWNSVFLARNQAFGYTREQMISYVFLVLIIQSLVMSAPSNDNIGGEISSGDLSNYLVKPISYLKLWFTRDLSSKLLNIVFAVCEFSLLALIFRPQFSFSVSAFSLLGSVFLTLSAIITYYLITKVAVLVAFWVPENTWGLMFTFLVLMEVLSGMIFPLDILPTWGVRLVEFTPFPYLIYYPITAMVGKLTGPQLVITMAKSLFWLLASYYLTVNIWRRGLKVYSAAGR